MGPWVEGDAGVTASNEPLWPDKAGRLEVVVQLQVPVKGGEKRTR
jgi:hypothetical protein